MALRALALSGGIAASVAMFVDEVLRGRPERFVSANALAWPDRRWLLSLMVVATIAVVAMGAIRMWRQGPPAVRRWHRLSHRLAPAILLGPLPALLEPREWEALPAAAALSAFVLLAERTFRMCMDAAPSQSPDAATDDSVTDTGTNTRDGDGSPQPPPGFGAIATHWLGARRARYVQRFGPIAIVIACVVAYAIYMSVFTIWAHWRFATYGYDLGQYNSIFWSTLHGRPLRCSPLNMVANWSDLSNHADLAVFALLPFYAIHPGAETLLIMQAAILALGAIPIYRFAARRLPRPYAMAIALCYLAYPPLHGSNFYDFHMQPIAATFVLATIDFLDQRRNWLAALTFVVALACREDISVGLAFLGAFFALSGRRPVAGLIVALVSSIYFVAMRFFIMPSFGTWWFADIYQDLSPDGAPGFAGVIATLLSNPFYALHTVLTTDKLRYGLQILLPLAFLPLRRSFLVLAVVPGAIFTILTSNYAPTTQISFQYSGHFTAYIFPAAALALAAYGRDARAATKRRAALGALLMASILATVHWGAIPPRSNFHGGFDRIPMGPPSVSERQYERDLLALDALIPRDASVAVSDHELPHISRMNLFTLRDGLFDADYLLYDVSSTFLGSDNAEWGLTNGQYEWFADRPGLALLKRVGVPPP